MSLAQQSTSLPPELGIPVSDWQRTPTTVQDEFLSLLKRVDALESRLNRDSWGSYSFGTIMKSLSLLLQNCGTPDIPEGLQGIGITFFVVGLISLVFMTFSGIRFG